MPETYAPAAPFIDSRHHLLDGLALVAQWVETAVSQARAAGIPANDDFRGLYISDEQVDGLLAQTPGVALWTNGNGRSHDPVRNARRDWHARTAASRAAGIPLRLDALAHTFGLSETEVDVLLLALAPELDPRYERLFAYLQDDVTRKRPSIDLILNLLAHQTGHTWNDKLAHRTLFAPDAPLRHHRLLTLFDPPGQVEPPLLAQFVRPVPHLTDHLLGHTRLDSQLANLAHLIANPVPLSHVLLPEEINTLTRSTRQPQAAHPIIAVVGPYGSGKSIIATHIAHAASQPLLLLNMSKLAQADGEAAELLALALRDGRIAHATLYLQRADAILQDGRFPTDLLRQLLAYPHVVVIGSAQPWQVRGGKRERPLLTLHLDAPAYEQRLALWQTHTNTANLEALANQFRFTPGQIADAAATAHDLAQQNGRSQPTTADLFAAARAHSNQKLATLATKIRPRYGWDDIILPVDTRRQLQEMVATVRQRPTVYGQWGFGRKLALGKGLHALFAGESGTGKTMSADIIARELGLDLYKVDLSTLVSKYIGETEKNLDRIFTEAATSNAILFFDEADAIFGKRSEVKDSHDRYANIEISYLLQRMEAYDGVVILATNLRANLDEAFTRRLHFAIEFPFPEPADRRRIWQVTFPADTPIAADVNFDLLANRFRLTGGNIRNIILAAAFLAAEDGTAVSQHHLLHATRREYQKLGRLIDEDLFKIND